MSKRAVTGLEHLADVALREHKVARRRVGESDATKSAAVKERGVGQHTRDARAAALLRLAAPRGRRRLQGWHRGGADALWGWVPLVVVQQRRRRRGRRRPKGPPRGTHDVGARPRRAWWRRHGRWGRRRGWGDGRHDADDGATRDDGGASDRAARDERCSDGCCCSDLHDCSLLTRPRKKAALPTKTR